MPARGHFPSRPDAIPRIDPESPPPRGYASPQIEDAMRDPPPWWAVLLMKRLDNDAELRAIRARLEVLEDAEDARSNTKTRIDAAEREAALALLTARKARVDRAWQIATPVIAALILMLVLWLSGFVHFGTSSGPPSHVEVKP